ncbi:MAG: nitroreductase [Christensenellales bacterium]|jgi:nitroreductase
MKETMHDLLTRRSCRKYLDKPIEEEVLDKVLEAGTFAPTGMGKQSPIIVAVRDKATRDALSKMNAAVMGSKGDPFYGAPVVVVVLADKNCGTYREDGSLVIGNMLIAAHALGLSSCWVHRAKEVFESSEGKALLRKWGITGDYEGIGNCILGYGAEGGVRDVAPRKKNYIVKV